MTTALVELRGQPRQVLHRQAESEGSEHVQRVERVTCIFATFSKAHRLLHDGYLALMHDFHLFGGKPRVAELLGREGQRSPEADDGIDELHHVIHDGEPGLATSSLLRERDLDDDRHLGLGSPRCIEDRSAHASARS